MEIKVKETWEESGVDRKFLYVCLESELGEFDIGKGKVKMYSTCFKQKRELEIKARDKIDV